MTEMTEIKEKTVALQSIAGTAMAHELQVRGHVLRIDGTAAEGGDDSGPNPHDLYDAALGACKALTVQWYARRKGLPLTEVRTQVQRDDSGERSGTYRLQTRLWVSGDLSDAQIAELQAVADKCPVHKLMTQVTTEVHTEVLRGA